jgi:hypothetical protein
MLPTDTTRSLELLASILELEGYDIPDLVVCGGSALQIIGLLDRATKDVDVIALLHIDTNGNKVLETSDPLPNAVMSAASQVARALDLSPDWLNSGPADLIRDLPVGFIDRLHSIRFGSRLVVHFIDRYDQIMFKTYAALNGGDIRHLSDLKALSPTDAEILEAAHWCLRQDASEVFPKIVRSFLEKTGYGNIIKQLDESNKE